VALFSESTNQSALNGRAVECDADSHRVGACVRDREGMRVALQEAMSMSLSNASIPTSFVTWQNLKSLHACISTELFVLHTRHGTRLHIH
jgi:hypothetical protein